MNKTKRLALQAIMLSIDSMRKEIEATMDIEKSLKNVAAIKILSEAYKNVKK